MFGLIHTYIHTYILVLLKKYKNKYFVNNFIGIVKYINTSPFECIIYDLKGVALWIRKIILV